MNDTWWERIAAILMGIVGAVLIAFCIGAGFVLTLVWIAAGGAFVIAIMIAVLIACGVAYALGGEGAMEELAKEFRKGRKNE